MSHHEIQKPTDISIPSNSLWAKLPMIGGVLGAIGLAITLAMASGEGKDRAMFSYLWAYEVGLSIALGALGWVMIEHVTRAAWGAVIRRIVETTAVTLPLFAVLWIPIGTLGFHSLYPWSHENDEILAHKRWFLSDGFFFGRAVAYLVIWGALSWFFYSRSTKQDAVAAGNVAERDRLTRSMWKMAAPGLILWALSLSFQAIDWMMSLQPHWYSTIFGVYYFAGAILSFFAFTALVVMGLQRAGVLKAAVTTEHFHDLGKLVFGYTVFWAYIAFSQFMLIWYANIPEETIFYAVRLEGGWKYISYLLPLMHFAIPFLYLLSRQIKRNRRLFAIGAVWVLLMHLIDLYWLILPNFGTHGEGAKEAVLAPNFTDVTALVGVLGAFMGVFGYFLKKNKVVSINDPRLEESLVHENY
jgi:hypothetical protein